MQYKPLQVTVSYKEWSISCKHFKDGVDCLQDMCQSELQTV